MLSTLGDDDKPDYMAAIAAVREQFGEYTPDRAHFQRLWGMRKTRYPEVLEQDAGKFPVQVEGPVNEITELVGEVPANPLEERRNKLQADWLEIAEGGIEALKLYTKQVLDRLESGEVLDHKAGYQLVHQAGIATDKAEKLRRVPLGSGGNPEVPNKAVFQVINLNNITPEQKKALLKRAMDGDDDIDIG
jgi:hypothetical protein